MMRAIFTTLGDFLKNCFLFCTLLCLLSFSISVTAEGTDNHKFYLTMAEGDGVSVVKPNSGLLDFKEINPMDYDDSSGYTLDGRFTVINHNNKPIVINAIRGTNPRSDYNFPYNDKTLPVTLLPEGLITIEVHYHLLPYSPGRFDTIENVFIDNQVEPAAVLQMAGTIRSVAVFDPPTLDFGKMRPGQIATRVLQVTYDRQMYPGRMPLAPEKLPFLVSDKSFISVVRTAIRTTKITMQSYGLTRTNATNKRYDYLSRFLEKMPPINNIVVYSVIVKSPPAIGTFHGYISVMPISGTQGSDLLKQTSVSVQGRVVSNN